MSNRKPHRALTPDDGIHAIIAAVVADESTRGALGWGFESVGKVVLQTSDRTFWVLRPAATSGVEWFGICAHYRHDQSAPASIWTVNHGLGKYPAVTVIDSAGEGVLGADITYVSPDQIVIAFSAAFSGTAICN